MPIEDQDFGPLSMQLCEALRGRSSRAALSRRLGYRSNVVHRWEIGESWPTAARFLDLCALRNGPVGTRLEAFYQRRPGWLDDCDSSHRMLVARLLSDLRGQTPIVELAERSGFNRYSISRWLKGSAEPKLPEFLALVQVTSRRLLDFVALFVDPTELPAVRTPWKVLQRSREVAYDMPWSHGVLRALELERYRSSARGSTGWLSKKLGIPLAQVERALEALQATGQVRKVRRRWQATDAGTVDTSRDFDRSRALKAGWAEVALERMRTGAPGNFGYSLFAVSAVDLRRLGDLQLAYVRAMQSIIASSAPAECVGLFCSQLLDLSKLPNNALARPRPGHAAKGDSTRTA